MQSQTHGGTRKQAKPQLDNTDSDRAEYSQICIYREIGANMEFCKKNRRRHTTVPTNSHAGSQRQRETQTETSKQID